MKAATENFKSNKKMMTFILDRREKNVQIINEIMKTAAENFGNNKKMMTFFSIDEKRTFRSSKK